MENGIVLVPSIKSHEIRKFLNKNSIGFSVNEIRSDDI